MTTMTRQQEIPTNLQKWIVISLLFGLFLYPFLDLFITDLKSLLQQLLPEAIGIGFTVFFLDKIYQQREEQRKITEKKERLVRETASTVRDVAVKAIEELRATGWLYFGLLNGATLFDASLWGLDLNNANLERASLNGANLSEANLLGANLSGAVLQDANLSGALLEHANLSGALLSFTNLSGAVLQRANLKGAYLGNANLSGVDFRNVTLPDGTKWTPDTDMERFTDTEHPEFKAILKKINAIREEMRLYLIG